MTKELEQVLQKRWMSQKESQIYLTVLELGSAPASVVWRRTDIKRVTTYSILKELETKQIASSFEKKGVKYFQVVDPEVLNKRLREMSDIFAQKVPELLALANLYDNKPRVQYFEGLNGMKELFDDMAHSTVDILAFLWLDEIHPDLRQRVIETHIPMRKKLDTFARVIVPQSDKNIEYERRDQLGHRKTKVIEDPVFKLYNEIDIYGPNKVAICMYTKDEMSGVLIHSKKLYESLSSMFELVWKN